MDNSGINQRTHIAVLDSRKPPFPGYSLQKDRYSVLALKWPPQPQGHKAATKLLLCPLVRHRLIMMLSVRSLHGSDDELHLTL